MTSRLLDRRRTVSAALFCLVFAAQVLEARAGQDPNPDVFEVSIVLADGRLKADRATAKVTLSPRYRALLRAGVTETQLAADFCDALSRHFRLMPKAYIFTLTNEEMDKELKGTLDSGEIDQLRSFTGPLSGFPRIGTLTQARDNPAGPFEGFEAQIQKISRRSGLSGWLSVDSAGSPVQLFRPFIFRLRDPLDVDKLKIVSGEILTSEKIRQLLRPLHGVPADPGKIRDVLLDVYTPRGVTPKIDLKPENDPSELSVVDTVRIARLLVPLELTDVTEAEQIVYVALPASVFNAFRKQSQSLISQTLDADVIKREIDLRLLLSAGSNLPAVDARELAEIQQALLALEFNATIFDFDPAHQLIDLVIDKTAGMGNVATEADTVTGAAATPRSTQPVSARPDAATDLQPAPLAPEPSGDQKRKQITPRLEQKHFIGAGIEYQPEQGIRFLGSFQRKDLLGQDDLRVELGGMGSSFGSAEYSRDYLWFGALGRRLSLDLKAGSDFESKRVIDDVLTDERRTGARARLDLEAFRGGPSHQAHVVAEAGQDTVSLTPDGAEAPTIEATLITADIGLNYFWRRRVTGHPFSVRLESSVRFGVKTEDLPGFQRLRVGAAYHDSISGPLELETRFEGRRTSVATPVFELPSLGGLESVRGFRSDEELGHAVWSWQNELWFPVMGSGAPSKLRDFVRRNVRVAGVFDLGRRIRTDADADTSVSELRRGAGIGLRVNYQGVTIAIDWVRGFGNATSDRPARGRFYFNFRLP